MTFTLAFALIPFGLGLIVFGVLSGVNAYHILKFGKFDVRNRVVVIAYLIYTVALLVISILYFLGVDWSTAVQFELPSIQGPTVTP